MTTLGFWLHHSPCSLGCWTNNTLAARSLSPKYPTQQLTFPVFNFSKSRMLFYFFYTQYIAKPLGTSTNDANTYPKQYYYFYLGFLYIRPCYCPCIDKSLFEKESPADVIFKTYINNYRKIFLRSTFIVPWYLPHRIFKFKAINVDKF